MKSKIKNILLSLSGILLMVLFLPFIFAFQTNFTVPAENISMFISCEDISGTPCDNSIYCYSIFYYPNGQIYSSHLDTNYYGTGIFNANISGQVFTTTGNYKLKTICNDTSNNVGISDNYFTITYSPLIPEVPIVAITGNISLSVNVPSYPYVDVNVSYPIELILFYNNARINLTYINLTDFKMVLTSPDTSISNFNFTFDEDSESYLLTLSFLEIGNYPFTIYTDPISDIENITGTFLVRNPYYIIFCGYYEDSGNSYINDYAYLTAEFTTSKKYYDSNLEQFITPLGFKTNFKTPIFHTFYRNGCGTLKLYEPETEYAIRLFDGEATFLTTFSPPNITETYGTNIYIGKYTFTGVDYSYRILLSDRDISQYSWLANTLFIIVLIAIVIISIFLFFVIPQMPQLSLILGVGGTVMLIIVRIVVWIWMW
jgi:hypothetical protein